MSRLWSHLPGRFHNPNSTEVAKYVSLFIPLLKLIKISTELPISVWRIKMT